MSDDTSLYDVIRWVQEQMVFLDRPASRLALWYLSVNAFRNTHNNEGVDVGRVLSGMTRVAKIQRGTGLSRKGVYDALHDLQSKGYILTSMVKGRGKSQIRVFWQAEANQWRADFRDGINPLPVEFQTPVKVVKERKDAVILQFPKQT